MLYSSLAPHNRHMYSCCRWQATLNGTSTYFKQSTLLAYTHAYYCIYDDTHTHTHTHTFDGDVREISPDCSTKLVVQCYNEGVTANTEELRGVERERKGGGRREEGGEGEAKQFDMSATNELPTNWGGTFCSMVVWCSSCASVGYNCIHEPLSRMSVHVQGPLVMVPSSTYTVGSGCLPPELNERFVRCQLW